MTAAYLTLVPITPMPPVPLSPRQGTETTSLNIGAIVGLSIAGAALLIIIACAVSHALARRRRFRKKPRRVSDISALNFGEQTRSRTISQHAQRAHKGRQGSENAGLLEAVKLEASQHAHENTRQTSYDSAELHPYDPPKLTISVPTDMSDRSSLESSPPRTRLASPQERLLGSPFLIPRTPSPLLRNLPPLIIPGRPPGAAAPKPPMPAPIPDPSPDAQPQPTQSLTPASVSTTTESDYSQGSATTFTHLALEVLPTSPPPPVPPLPTYLPPLPAHIEDRVISRSDSRATIQRGDTRAVSEMLKARAQRLSKAADFDARLTRGDTHISRIERYGSLDDQTFPVLQSIPEVLKTGPPVELTTAFKNSVYSPCSSISSKNTSQRSNLDSISSGRTAEGASNVVIATNEHLYDSFAVIQPLRIASHKARGASLDSSRSRRTSVV